MTDTIKTKRHRHEQSMWFIASGAWMWCYQCGAIKLSNVPAGTRWTKPTGEGGVNPAMRDGYRSQA